MLKLLKVLEIVKIWSTLVDTIKKLLSKGAEITANKVNGVPVDKIAIVCNNESQYRRYILEQGMNPRNCKRLHNKSYLRGFNYRQVIYIEGYS